MGYGDDEWCDFDDDEEEFDNSPLGTMLLKLDLCASEWNCASNSQKRRWQEQYRNMLNFEKSKSCKTSNPTPKTFSPNVGDKQNLYHIADKAKVGTEIMCPCGCGKSFKKKSYQHKFFTNKGENNCKDNYWNRVDPSRACRAMAYVKI